MKGKNKVIVLEFGLKLFEKPHQLYNDSGTLDCVESRASCL